MVASGRNRSRRTWSIQASKRHGIACRRTLTGVQNLWRHFDNSFRIHCKEEVGVFVYIFRHFLIKLFSVYVWQWCISWCCVTKNIEMSLLFLLFVGAISLLWILSPIDVTLYFNGLGIFDYISRACWSKSMCGQRMVDVLHWWIIELTIWAPRSQTSNDEKSHT